MKKHLRSILTGVVLLLTGCSTAKVEDYAAMTPKLDIRQFLSGDVEAWGVFIDRSGMADPRFHVTMKGTWNGNTGTLEEHFTYSDGRKETRTWVVTFTDENHFTATAGDVIGKAEGKQFGNAVNMRYVLAINNKGTTYNMDMDDWMYLMNDTTLINRTTMSKFGITIGELVLTFKKL